MSKEVYCAPYEDGVIDHSFYISSPGYPLSIREWQRFDFADEWNNLGYGRIEKGDSPFSLSMLNTEHIEFSHIISEVIHFDTHEKICVFAGIIEKEDKATLWINREMGLRDGVDFYLIEDFLCHYKNERFGSVPVLSEIPYGFSAAVTMRIDCDEEIASGRKLFELYKSHNIPFSLAITTNQDIGVDSIHLINDVIKHNGAVVSHSHTHASDWGGTQEKAEQEIYTSQKILKALLPDQYSMDWVVSPFHQNSQNAIKGLVKAGIRGFIGGLIKNDPQYLQARAGEVISGEKIITHSQQCMLHGDSYRLTGIDIYKKTFENHYHSNTFFGFLDHPFSSTYSYGWANEEERLNIHDQFIKYMKEFDSVWFTNLVEAMNFLWVKSYTKVWVENDQLKWSVPKHSFKDIPDMKVQWNEKEFRIPT